MKKGHFWLGAGISGIALFLAFRQIELGRLGAVVGQVDYGLVAAAAGLQLGVVGAIAGRWRLLFRKRPGFGRLVGSLLIAQLVNGVIPVRLGMLARAFLVGREEGQSKIAVFTTVVVEKVFDSLILVLLFAAVLPLVAEEWFQWSALRLSTGVLAGLFPVLVLVTYQRRRMLELVKSVLRRVPWTERIGLVQKFEAGLEGLVKLRGGSVLALLWGWTLAIAGLGVLVNWVVLHAFGIPMPAMAAVFLFVVLQIGSKVLPATPLGGLGVFHVICQEALVLFGVDRELALGYGFVLHFVVFVPGAMLGAVALLRTSGSLRELREGVADGNRRGHVDTEGERPGDGENV